MTTQEDKIEPVKKSAQKMFQDDDAKKKAADKMVDKSCRDVDFEHSDVLFDVFEFRNFLFNHRGLKRFLPGIKFPGLCSIKKIEMNEKYWPLIPRSFK